MRPSVRLWPILLFALVCSGAVEGNQLARALEAGNNGVQFLEGGLTGLYQSALEASEDTGNYEIDLIGSIVLRQADGETVGSTDFVFWAFHVDNLGNLQSTGKLAQKAGLLWDTNDINVDNSVTQFGVFGLRQFFLNDRLDLGIGKLFPGMIHTESAYTANNSETYTTKIISASAVGGYFEAIGLGANLKYWGNSWFVQGGFSDAKAESEFDFSSLADGVLAWTAEAGWAPRQLGGDTAVSLLAFRVDQTPTLDKQTGWALAGTHDFGESRRYGIFGRYTRASGGEGRGQENADAALPLKSAAYLGFAFNRPLGRVNDQLGLAALYGQPTEYRESQGFSSQYGVEAFWKIGISRIFRITPSLQLLRNREDEVEYVIGIRAKIAADFAQYFKRR